MKTLIVVSILIFFWALPIVAQNKVLLQGEVVDARTGHPIVGANVHTKGYRGATDAKGMFSISLAKGEYTLTCSSIGYERLDTLVHLQKNSSIVVKLVEDVKALEEITVTSRSRKNKIRDVQIGVEKVEIAELAKVPALFGERDIIKSIRLLPGVKSESEATSGYQVRGGTATQNLILLDGATVYNAGHLMGIFSSFNDDALINASLYKGMVPAQYGGATSSVFDIYVKPGSMNDYKFGGTVGLLSAKVYAEGPISKDKASFFLAARRSYLDMFLKATKDYKDNTLNFYDINAKVSYNINANDRLSLSFFRSRDNMGIKDLMDMGWGNTALTAKWFHYFGEKLSSNTSLIYSDYGNDMSMEILSSNYSSKGFIRHASLNHNFVWSPSKSHHLDIGLQSSYIQLKSAEWQINNLHQIEKRNAWENNLWLNEEWAASDKLTLSAGIRLSAFSVLGGSPYYNLNDNGDIVDTLNYSKGKFIKTHIVVEPRLSLKYSIGENQSIKAGYARTSQNVYAVRNSSASMPFDRYTMSSNILKPQIANQISLGYMALSKDSKYEFSIEGYYKNVDHVYDYKDGKTFRSEIEMERLVLGGKGRAYGAELYARKNIGRLTGWISYTLSWSENKIKGINNDNWYTAGNDRRHDIAVVAMYKLSKSWDFSATWVFNTGKALTAPSAKYEIDGRTYYYYAERNGYRAPDYHRLDISFSHTKKLKHCIRQWSFGLYNAYGRYNPFVIRFENDDTKLSGTKAVQYSLYSFVPSISYNLKF